MTSPIVKEADPPRATITTDADPPLVDYGIFDIGLFDYPLFDTGEVSIDDDPPPVAIMVEAEP
jgi:hypothetical protein